MGHSNAYFRRQNTRHVATTGGIPDFYLSTVRMFRAAFPQGLSIDSPDYTAVCVFLDHEGYGHRQIAQMLDFSFDLGYLDVFNARLHPRRRSAAARGRENPGTVARARAGVLEERRRVRPGH